MVLNGDGSVTFTPDAGYEGAASFDYKVIDQQGLTSVSPGTVALTVTDPVWYVDSNAAGGGDGTYLNPFKTIAELDAGGAFNGANDFNDTIFFYDRGSAYTGSIHALASGQKLLGDGSSLTAVNGLTIGASSSNTSLSSAGLTLITLGSGNTLSGLTLGNASTDVLGSSFGTLTVSSVTISSNGQALDLTNGAFSAGSAFTSITSTGGTHNISLANVTGSVDLGSGALSGASGSAFDVAGGTVSTTYSGNITETANAAMVNVTGGQTRAR